MEPMPTTARLVEELRRKTFDVICAGEPHWRMARAQDGLVRSGIRFRSSVIEVARLLARTGIRVGLATVLDDDAFGRAPLESLAAAGVDIGGVVLAPPARGLVVVDAGGCQSDVLSERETERVFEVPPAWSSQVLLLSGLSPITSAAALLCKAARRARREGTTVVLDFNASLRLWAGRDHRPVFMVLREADVARCSFADLAVLGMDAATVRKAMRPGATLVISDATGATATGPSGEVRCALLDDDVLRTERTGDSFTAVVCAELARTRTAADAVTLLARRARGSPG
jgi:sugar/nucleoside kinase (ribokinase family)